MRNWKFWILPGLVILGILGVLLYQLPPINDRLAWRMDELRAQIKYALNPPEEAVFIPQDQQEIVNAIAQSTLLALTPSPTPSPTQPTSTPVPTGENNTQEPTSTPTSLSTGIPNQVQLDGVIHEFQQWNNCGPANLSMGLSFWEWAGDQRDTAAYLKPNDRDKNVMPYEMVRFVNEETNLSAIWRVGGDLGLMKQLIAGGFPVIVEKGFEGPDFPGWMGHYELVTGYDDALELFTAQDSYIMEDLPIPYDQMETYWQQFNYTYVVIFRPDRESEVMSILGPASDELTNFNAAAAQSSDEIFSMTGRDQYFAWFNRGTNLVYLDDYAGAALAYDEAFAIYPTIPEDQRPWRMMWYQTGPYWAYYYTGRFYDVYNLATTTIENASEPAIEETWYWRALAREALGDIDGAIADLQEAIKLNENFETGKFHLNRILGG